MPKNLRKRRMPPGVRLRHKLNSNDPHHHRLVWSPNGRILASCSMDSVIKLWNNETGQLLKKLEGHTEAVIDVAWSPDNQMIGSVSDDRTIKIWDATLGIELQTLKSPASSLSITWSPDGQQIATGTQNGDIAIWEIHSWNHRYLSGHTAPVSTLKWLVDGETIVSGSLDNSIRLWNGRSGGLRQVLEGHAKAIYSIACSQDGQMIASGSEDETVRLWSIKSGQQVNILEGHTSVVSGVSFSSDGNLLASSSIDGTILLWGTDVLKVVAKFDEEPVECTISGISFHPHSPVLATPSGENINTWNVNVRTLLKSKQQVSETIHYSNAKVVLLGDSGVGKSALGLVLTGMPFVPTESTHGRRVWTLDNAYTAASKEGLVETREVLIWDLAGQPGYRLIHQLHLSEVAVALVLFDSRSETDPFAGVQYWERALRQAQLVQGRQGVSLKKILVESRADRGGVSASTERINKIVKDLGFEKYIKTSAKEGWGIAELHEAIHEAINWTTLPRISSTGLFHKIKSFLVSEKAAGRLLSTVDDLYRAYLRANEPSDPIEDLREQFDTCIGRVEASGLILRLNFGDLVLLQPELLDGYAAAIINAAKSEPDGLGYINEEDARSGRFRIAEDDRIKDREQEKLLLISTVENLLRHEIALREEINRDTYLVFPSQLTRENPNLPDPEGKAVIFSFDGPILNIYATLAVRLSRSGVFKKKDMWKNAVTFTTSNGGTYGIFLRETQEGHGELTLFFDTEVKDEMRLQFEEYIHAHLHRRALPSSISRRRIFICPNPTCQTPVSDIVAKRRRERGYTTISCPVCGTEISIIDSRTEDVSIDLSLFHEIDRAADIKRERETAASIVQGKLITRDFDVLLLYNSIDKPIVREIAEQLKDHGILPWFDEWEVIPGSIWNQVLERDLGKIKSAIVFIGKENTSRWEKAEQVAYLHEFANTGRPLASVILQKSKKPGQVPNILKGTVAIDFSNHSDDFIEQLILAITGDHYVSTFNASPSLRSQRKNISTPQDTKRDDIKRRVNDAVKREDWAAARQYTVELAQTVLADKQPDEAANLALSALMIADDPQKLDGKGLREPLQLLAELNPRLIEVAMGQCHHRKEIISELRFVASPGRIEVMDLIKSLGISRWDDWFKNSPPDTSKIDALPREGQGFPSIRLLRLRLENIKNFENIHLNLRENNELLHNCFAIVGDNATGKTTLLQAIALGCLGPSLVNQEVLNARNLLRHHAESGVIEIEFELSVDSEATKDERIPISVGLEIVRKELSFRPLAHQRMEFSKFNAAEHWAALHNQVNFNWGLCCGYGAFRALREEREDLSSGINIRAEINSIYSLFQPQSTLLDPQTLQAILRTDVSGISKDRQNIPLGIRNEILKMFSEVIPGIEVQENNGQHELVEKWDGVKTLTILSDGYNSMIGLLGHLVEHILEHLGWLNKFEKDKPLENLLSPLAAVGIVLIDEVDLHLHPIWQRYILSQLQGAFPNIQFIVTTHSPLVLGAVPDVQVIVLKRNEENKIEALTDFPSVRGWRVDQLLTGLPFEVSSAYDPLTERLSVRYARLLSELGPEHEDVIALERELDALNPISQGSTHLDRKAWELLNEFADYRLAVMTQEEREQTLAKIWKMLKE